MSYEFSYVPYGILIWLPVLAAITCQGLDNDGNQMTASYKESVTVSCSEEAATVSGAAHLTSECSRSGQFVPGLQTCEGVQLSLIGFIGLK